MQLCQGFGSSVGSDMRIPFPPPLWLCHLNMGLLCWEKRWLFRAPPLLIFHWQDLVLWPHLRTRGWELQLSVCLGRSREMHIVS